MMSCVVQSNLIPSKIRITGLLVVQYSLEQKLNWYHLQIPIFKFQILRSGDGIMINTRIYFLLIVMAISTLMRTITSGEVIYLLRSKLSPKRRPITKQLKSQKLVDDKPSRLMKLIHIHFQLIEMDMLI